MTRRGILDRVRWSLLLLLVAIPTLALAKPKVAVAPLDGDDGKVASAVVDAARDRAKVTKPGRVENTMRSMGVSVLSAKTIRKLRDRLDADVVIYGDVEKDGREKKLSLQLAGNGKSKLTIRFKSTKELRDDLARRLPKRIADAMEGSGGDDDDEDREDRERRDREARARREEQERKQREEEERRRDEERRAEERRKRDEEDRRKRDEDERRAERKKRDDDRRKKKRDRDDDEEDDRRASRKKRGDDDDDRRASRRKRGDDDDDDRRKRRRGDDDDDDRDRRRRRVADRDDDDRDRDRDEDEEDDDDRGRRKRKSKRHELTQAALWLDGGAAVARRTLTYEATGAMTPPRVGTAAAAFRIEGEVYPAAFSSLKGPAAGIGVFAAYSRTVGLGIAVPGTQVTAPIENGQYALGARYRVTFGEHAVGFGIAYWRSYYMADRTALMMPDQLDMPDVDYKAIAPGIAARVAATPKISVFGSLAVPLMLNSGPIQDPASYGASKILAIDFRAGTQITLASHVALELGLDIEQVGLSFTGQPGSMSVARMVTKATDRSVGISATLGVFY